MEARDERRLLKLQAQLTAVKLLIVDELGYVPLSQTGAELLFEIFSQRHERGSTIVTSNLPFEEWTSVFGSQRLTGALLDRLTHHVHILELNGESYRLKQSKARRRRDPRPSDETAKATTQKLAKSSPLPESRARPAAKSRPSPPGRTRRVELYAHAENWPGFAPPYWQTFTPPLTTCPGTTRSYVDGVVARRISRAEFGFYRPDHAVFLEERTESGRPASSMRFRTATPMAASVC